MRRRVLMVAALLLMAATPAVAQDGHANHDGHAGHGTPQARPDPHAGHVMPTAQPDPHAGHRMPTAQPDPHAGHRMPAAQPDPHAGHVMAGPTPPDVRTSTDDAGRAPQTPPPPEAFSGPAHAADTIFGADAMAASRAALVAETGAMGTTAVMLERLEAGFGEDDTAFVWDAQGWIGGDIHRFVWKTEGEGDVDGGVEAFEVQALYSRAVLPFWDVQVGVRHDVVDGGDDTTYLVAGVQGMTAGWWEVDAAAFVSTEGQVTARAEAEWDVRLTQRWILQPRGELELSASDEPALGLTPGFTGVEAGLRLRYEIRREVAPYVGVEWHRALGGAADLARASGHPVEETRLLIGLRAWY
jgi:copper resistance protein B